MRPLRGCPPLALFALAAVSSARAQSLPPTAPTAMPNAMQSGAAAPLAAASTGEQPGMARHRAEVSCANGQLTIRANNSSLNGILRAISRCTGMTVTGGVADQRVFGNYGPTAPATVLATLLDGTGVNMLLQETAADQPAQLILTPRTGGVTPPSPSQATDTDDAELDQPTRPNAQPSVQPTTQTQPGRQTGIPSNTLYAHQGTANPQPALVNPGLQPYQGAGNNPNSAVTATPSIPQPINNVNGSPSNTSPTAATYPTTNSISPDALPTPSTTPSTTGIVDAPNPPPAGSDTAALLNGSTTAVPGTTNVQGRNTSTTTLPGGTNTTLPAPNPTDGGQGTGSLTPQQVFDQLRQMQQQLQQQSGAQNNSQTNAQSSGSSTTPQ